MAESRERAAPPWRGIGRRIANACSPRTIRGRLLALLLACALPGALLAALLNAEGAFQEAEHSLRRRVAMARDLIAARIEARIEAVEQRLMGAAALMPQEALLARGGEAACAAILAALAPPAEMPRPEARNGAAMHALLAGDGTPLCVSPPDAAADWPFASLMWALRAATPAAGGIVDLLPSPNAPEGAAVAVAVPLGPAGGATRAVPGGGALVAALPLTRFAADVHAASTDAPSHLVWLANADAAEMVFAPPVPLTAVASAAPPPAGWLDAASPGAPPVALATAGGTPVLVAVARLAPGLTLILAEPSLEPLRAARREARRRFLELSLLFLANTAALAFGIGAWVVRPLEQLRETLPRWRGAAGPRPVLLDGERDRHWPDEVRDLAAGFEHAAERLAAQEAELRAALERSELLMAEVHHRVKNNLQIVSSLLNLQGARIAEPAARAEFEAARDRVRALATLHRHLYMHPDHEAIDLGAFIEELAGQIFQASGERPGDRIALAVRAPSLRISSDQAVPLALVITEAVTNALAYAFPGGRHGRLEVTLTAEGERARLSVRDDGVGGGLDRAADRRGLGNQLVRALARQLGGELRVETGAGTMVTLDFPLRPAALRPAPHRRAAPS
ncbi:sensor histidine kinase [Caldovatus sediminis]|uniref:sensor histidine kinase n=1 Tax=Caldovatus sediminis TaxID=2041189 RepID=UPI00166CDDF9|nr:sensor histidine kinase [Caldovatus sediminis]